MNTLLGVKVYRIGVRQVKQEQLSADIFGYHYHCYVVEDMITSAEYNAEDLTISYRTRIGIPFTLGIDITDAKMLGDFIATNTRETDDKNSKKTKLFLDRDIAVMALKERVNEVEETYKNVISITCDE